jgi:WD40 repeat protein
VTETGLAVSGSWDGTVRVWDLSTGRLHATLEGHTGGVRAVAVTETGLAVSGSWDGTVRVWDLSAGRLHATLAGHTGVVTAVAVTDTGLAVAGSEDGTVRVWDLDSGRCLAVFPWEYPISSIAVTPDAPHMVVAGDARGNVLFFRLENLDRI